MNHLKIILLSTFIASGCLVANEDLYRENKSLKRENKSLKKEIKALRPASCLEDIKIFVGVASLICLTCYLIPRPPK
jgi:hypothetical protein